MGTLEIFLCIVVGTLVPVQAIFEEREASFFQGFPGFFENIFHFPFERNFDFPYDTIFSSRQTGTPDFHMLAELPPQMKVPRIQVFCNASQVTLLVDKWFNGVSLSREELQLGNGCYSNGDLENQFVFIYNVDECETAHVMQNGLEVISNFLHFKPQKSLSFWWRTPFAVRISCIPKRSDEKPPNFLVSLAPPENDRSFDMKAMNPSWTAAAESIMYKRGQVVNLQVTAKTSPDQRLFIHSCFASASPDPEIRPRHVVVMNKGCAVSLGPPHAVTRFVASDREDVVNFALNISQLNSQLYDVVNPPSLKLHIHCSVLVSDPDITPASKSCNYNRIQSRWEELSGNVEVCKCCSTRCKASSLKHLPDDAKTIVSIGPLVIVDTEVELRPVSRPSELLEPSSTPVSESMQSDASDPAVTEYKTSSASQFGSRTQKDEVVSAAASPSRKMSKSLRSSPPQGVVVVSQNPVSSLTFWLPGQVEFADAELDHVDSSLGKDFILELQPSGVLSNNVLELHPSVLDRDSRLNTPNNDAPMWDMNVVTVVGEWAIPPQLEKAATAEESQRKRWGGGNLKAVMINDLNEKDFDHFSDGLDSNEADVLHHGEATDVQPVIRSKLQFSKGVDGSQTLSYEEEVVKREDKGTRRRGMDGMRRRREGGQKSLFSAFLNLLRNLDKAE